MTYSRDDRLHNARFETYDDALAEGLIDIDDLPDEEPKRKDDSASIEEINAHLLRSENWPSVDVDF